MSDKCKMTILVVVVIIAAILLLNDGDHKKGSYTEAMHNDGALSYDPDRNQTLYNDITDNDTNDLPEDLESNDSSKSAGTLSFDDRNSQEENNYKYSSYKKGNRKTSGSGLDAFFETNSALGDSNYSGFTGQDETSGKFAAYSSGKKKKLSTKDKFDASQLLPVEKNDGWFEDPQEQPISVKNAHMINTFRPLGVNTVSTTLKNACHDLRGSLANPRNMVSPWGMSSIEPDNNVRNASLCNN